jgi:peptidoglycan hydrolase-like protein with peptidoglycan-binding domain
MSNELTPSAPADPNSVLFKYQPTGASNVTANQDRLPQRGFTGVAASRKMAESDRARVLALTDKFVAAGRQFSIPPALLAAIASRETRGGAVLRDGWGDHHNGFGVMQVDKRHHVVEGTDDPFGLSHIMQATRILRASIDQVAHNQPNWLAVRQMQGGVAGYNEGPGKVMTLDRTDVGSTGNDYSNDVWARAQFYATQMGTAAPPVLTPPSSGISQPLSFPAPALSAVLAGTSILARGQKGDAVLSLQNALIMLRYLLLTEEEKQSGLGSFGPKTEQALMSFQHDVYLTGNGKCDALTFLALSQVLSGSVRRGNANQVGIVRRLQDRLGARGVLLQSRVRGGYGNFGPLTEGSLKSFQQAQGQPPDGVLTLASYLTLRALAPDAPPAISPPTDGDATRINVQLPRGGPGFIIKSGSSAVHQFGTERTIRRFMAFASEWITKGGEFPLRTGEISKLGGGLYPPHIGSGHSNGIAVDIGLFRRDRENVPTNIHEPSYDRALTQRLITVLDESPLVSLMIFNDPQIKASKKLHHDRAGVNVHDNHIHAEFA